MANPYFEPTNGPQEAPSRRSVALEALVQVFAPPDPADVPDGRTGAGGGQPTKLA